MFTLLKSQSKHDPRQHVKPNKYHTVVFHQTSSFCPDDFNLNAQLPSTKFKLSKGGLLKLTLGHRFIQNPNYNLDTTVVARTLVSHQKYRNRKEVGKTRVVTNGPCDLVTTSMPFWVEPGTEVWADIWQMNASGIPYQLEYVYLSVEVW